MAIFIYGPTASGKSQLALALAERIGGQIVNADSMQVYRDLCWLTARPGPEDTGSIRHHLYGYVDGARRWSVGLWDRDARVCMDRIRNQGGCPIVVGGTGMAFMALEGGLSPIPAVSEEARKRAQAQVAAGEGAYLLSRFDPVSARRIAVTDVHRQVRALAVWHGTGRPISSFYGQSGIAVDFPWAGIVLVPPREWVHRRIAERFVLALESGAVEEVQALCKRGLDPGLPIMKSHGVPWISSWLNRSISHETMVEKSVIDMRRYAKRQYTWAAHRLSGWSRVADIDMEKRIEMISALVCRNVDMAQGGG